MYSTSQKTQEDTEQRSQVLEAPIVEVMNPTYYGTESSRSPFLGPWSRTLRIKITGRDGLERLDLRIPVSH